MTESHPIFDTFIFDLDGKMVYSHTSYLPGGEMELIQKIKTLQ